MRPTTRRLPVVYFLALLLHTHRVVSFSTCRSTHSQQFHCRDVQRSASDSNDNSKSVLDEGDDFMVSLASRLKEVTDRETKLPLVVLDSMLPRQVLRIAVNNPVFMDLIRTRIAQETPWFGMLGLARLASGESVLMKSGVQVDIVGKPTVDPEKGLQLELRGGRRFRIVGEVETAPAGWTEARIEFLNSDTSETALPNARQRSDSSSSSSVLNNRVLRLAAASSKAKPLATLVPEWIELARTKERQVGQIDRLLIDLGPIPNAEVDPSDVAFWVGALINPLPAMGVALEIRPALLTATNAEERVDIAVTGITRSIRHMQGEPLVPSSQSE